MVVERGRKRRGGGDGGREAGRGSAGADVSGSILFGVLVSRLRTIFWILLGDNFWLCFRIPFLPSSGYCSCVSFRWLWVLLHTFLREGGPRILWFLLGVVVSLEKYKNIGFSVLWAMLGPSVDKVYASVYGAFNQYYNHFLRENGLGERSRCSHLIVWTLFLRASCMWCSCVSPRAVGRIPTFFFLM